MCDLALPYVAVFCPRCGEHVNMVEDDAGEMLMLPRPHNWGSLYTCGWCGVQTTDWSHVGQCRRLHADGAKGIARRMREHGARLRVLQQELEEAVT